METGKEANSGFHNLIPPGRQEAIAKEQVLLIVIRKSEELNQQQTSNPVHAQGDLPEFYADASQFSINLID